MFPLGVFIIVMTLFSCLLSYFMKKTVNTQHSRLPEEQNQKLNKPAGVSAMTSSSSHAQIRLEGAWKQGGWWHAGKHRYSSYLSWSLSISINIYILQTVVGTSTCLIEF